MIYQVGFLNNGFKFISEEIVFINFETKTIGFWAINCFGKKKIFERNLDDVILMQYTGYKDKNHKKIYCKDVVKTPYYGIRKVSDNLIQVALDGFYTSSPNSFEIIGNSYLKPDLLNEVK
jgi:uncharacterized phage protein (TIGR01671 family)